VACAIVLVAALALPASASAQVTEGNILSIDPSGEIVIDLGASRGVATGDLLEVWRPLRFKNPVTGKTINDRILIAKLRVKQARPELAIARVEGDVERQLAPGDVVLAANAAPAPAPAPPPTPAPPLPAPAPAPAKPARPASPTTVTTTTTTTHTATTVPTLPPHADADARELDELFGSLKNATPDARIVAYEKFVLEHPQSRHANAVWVEAKSLRRLLEMNLREVERENQRPKPGGFAGPKTAPVGAPLELALELEKARGAVLHVRRAGEQGYVSTPMRETGASYFAGSIPAATMSEGTIEYFVEATDSNGEVHAVAGSAPAPLAVKAENPLPPDSRKREEGTIVRAGALTDYASFSSKSNQDYVWQSEAQLGARFRDVGLRALRSGFGAYRGRGGTLQDLDQKGLAGRDVGLTYGYLETELAPDSILAFVVRAIVGLREDGVSGGAQGFLRIGNDRRTNLLIGGEVLGGIGLRGITQLEWNLLPRVPVMLRSEVTNQPAGVSVPKSASGLASTGQGEVGVRSIVQVGYRVLPSLVVAGRGSFQARTINHAGPGAGAAVTYEW
jgi:hypothetical protein